MFCVVVMLYAIIKSGNITSLAWESASMYFASAGGSDRYIRVWHNAVGQKILVDELKGKLPKATSEALKVTIGFRFLNIFIVS